MELKRIASFPVDRIPPYLLGSIAQSVLQARVSGRDVVDLSQVHTDSAAPDVVVERIVRESLLPQSYRYSASQGISELRDEICRYYRRRFGVELQTDKNVVVTMGTKEGLAHLLWAIVNPGENIIVPTPTYPIHAAAVYLAGAGYLGIPLLPDLEAASASNYVLNDGSESFFSELERSFLRSYPHPGVLILSFPHNPTSAVVDESFFRRIVDFAIKHQVYVVHDFAYAEMTFDGFAAPSLLSVPRAEEVGIEFFSLSKSFGIAGCRVGFAVGNERLVGALKKIKSYIDFGIFQPVQLAAKDALAEGTGYCQQMRDRYQARRDVLVSGLNDQGWRAVSGLGTLFVWARIPERYADRGLSSMEVCHRLLDRVGVATCPGEGFGSDAGQYVRFALVEPEERIRLALDRMANLDL